MRKRNLFPFSFFLFHSFSFPCEKAQPFSYFPTNYTKQTLIDSETHLGILKKQMWTKQTIANWEAQLKLYHPNFNTILNEWGRQTHIYEFTQKINIHLEREREREWVTEMNRGVEVGSFGMERESVRQALELRQQTRHFPICIYSCTYELCVWIYTAISLQQCL